MWKVRYDGRRGYERVMGIVCVREVEVVWVGREEIGGMELGMEGRMNGRLENLGRWNGSEIGVVLDVRERDVGGRKEVDKIGGWVRIVGIVRN